MCVKDGGRGHGDVGVALGLDRGHRQGLPLLSLGRRREGAGGEDNDPWRRGRKRRRRRERRWRRRKRMSD